MNTIIASTIGIFSLAILWSFWGYFSSRVEQAQYTIIKTTKSYQIRNYPTHIVAQTKVNDDFDQALNQGFRIIAGYIFGGNQKNQSIAMTAPVTEQKQLSEKIAMTSPVLTKKAGKSNIIAFVMPKSYTLKTLPKPNNERVELLEIPAKNFAVLKFSWYRTDQSIKKNQLKLLTALAKDHIEPKSEAIYAGYNAPWTPPWMIRNEVMYEIKSKPSS